MAATIGKRFSATLELPRRFPQAFASASLVLLVFAVYLPSLSNGFVWDDHHLITTNQSLTQQDAISGAFQKDFWAAASQFQSDYYRPVITVSYTTDRWLYGLDPRGYHATNVLIHAAVTVLLFVFLTQLGLTVSRAVLAAALFGCHPVLTESVAWVSGRTDSTATLLILLCLVADPHSRKPRWAMLTMIALIGALLAKEVAVVVPVLAVAAGVARGERLGRACRDRIYMLPVVLGYFLVRFLVLGSPIASLGAAGSQSLASRLLFPWHFVGLLPLPMRARVDYLERLPPEDLIASAAAGLLLLLLLIWVGLRERSRSDSRLILSLVTCGLVALAPSAGAIFLKGVAGDRLVYLSSAFLLSALAVAIGRTLPTRLAVSLLVAATIGSAMWTVAKVPRWTSDTTLFESAIHGRSPSVRAHLNLAGAYYSGGRLLESFDTVNDAISLIDSVETSGALLPYQRSFAYTMSASAYQLAGCEDRALSLFREALELNPLNEFASHGSSGLLAATGRLEDAKSVLASALAFSSDPGLVAAMTQLVLVSPEAHIRPISRCGGLEAVRVRLGDGDFLNLRAQELLDAKRYGLAAILIRAAMHLDGSGSHDWSE